MTSDRTADPFVPDPRPHPVRAGQGWAKVSEILERFGYTEAG